MRATAQVFGTLSSYVQRAFLFLNFTLLFVFVARCDRQAVL